jgi:uncharacterized protein YpuA (DUF1002 family)
MSEREQIKCPQCYLTQYVTESRACRRCKITLLQGSVEITRVVMVHTQSVAVMPMRQVMRAAALNAVQQIGQTTKAAKALGIPYDRLNQLLKEAGYNKNHRKIRTVKGKTPTCSS